MKAIVCPVYGSPDVLKYVEVKKPVPKDDEVLVKVIAASLNPYDWHNMRGTPLLMRLGTGFLKPKNTVLGSDMAGQVEGVGKDVKRFCEGDEVFGACGYGAFAEYVSISEARLTSKPTGVAFEDVAALPIAGISALQGLRAKGQIQPEKKVLVNGAAGGVGTYAIQLAKLFGAEVTGVCSTAKLDLVRLLGADKAIDYSKEDFTKNGQRYDFILDTAAHRSLFDYKRVLSPQGKYVLIGGSDFFLKMLQLAWITLMARAKIQPEKSEMSFTIAKIMIEDLTFLANLLVEGKIKSVLDRTYPLPETAEAIRYLEEGHAKGKVIIAVS